MFILLAIALLCAPVATHAIPSVYRLEAEALASRLHNTETNDELRTPVYPEKTAADFYFSHVFSYANKPYNTLITKVTEQDLPTLFSMIEKISSELGIDMPAVFFANDTQSHVDVKFATFDMQSALLIHPATLTTLSPRNLGHYLEQIMMRIQNTQQQHLQQAQALERKHLIHRLIRMAGSGALGAFAAYLVNRNTGGSNAENGSAAAAPTQGAGAARSGKSSVFPTTAAGLLTTLLANEIIARLQKNILKDRVTSYTVQRMTSRYDKQEAREEFLPGSTPSAVIEPIYDATPYDAFETIIQNTGAQLRKRNDDFEALMEQEKNNDKLDVLDELDELDDQDSETTPSE
jgi:hypothetical protein